MRSIFLSFLFFINPLFTLYPFLYFLRSNFPFIMRSLSSVTSDIVKLPTVSDNILVIHGDELDAAQDLLLLVTWVRKVAVQPLNFSHFYYEEIYLKLNQMVNSLYLLCNICWKHSKDLAKSMRVQGYNYILLR